MQRSVAVLCADLWCYAALCAVLVEIILHFPTVNIRSLHCLIGVSEATKRVWTGLRRTYSV
jgi:hypothetical protein